MGIYEGLLFLKRQGVSLRVIPLSMSGRVLYNGTDNKYKYDIEVNEEFPLDKQVKVVLHELLHFTPQFSYWLGQRLGPEHPIEKKIDSLAEIIFEYQPVLVEFLRQHLRGERKSLRAFTKERKIALPGFEPGSRPPRGHMLDHYTTGL